MVERANAMDVDFEDGSEAVHDLNRDENHSHASKMSLSHRPVGCSGRATDSPWGCPGATVFIYIFIYIAYMGAKVHLL